MINSKSITIDLNILNIIAEIDEFKGRWDNLGKLSPDRLSVLRRVATIESVGSSTRIEGAKLTDYQIETLLANLDIQSFKNRDEEEVAGYAEVMNIIFESSDQIPISKNYIKQLHGMLLKYSTKDTSHRGEYKKLPNNVEAFTPDGKSIGVIFETASPFNTPRLMTDLISRTSIALQNREIHPLLVIASFVVLFLAIHPFQDGNGRLSRVLTALLLLKYGYLYIPYSSLERIVEENKDTYYRALRASQRNIMTEKENIDDWVRFFLGTLKKQKDTLLRKLEQEQLLGKLPLASEQLLALAKERGRLTMADAIALLSINRNTAKDHLRLLVQKGYLIKNGAGKTTWYSTGV